jgi:hypothetical protein
MLSIERGTCYAIFVYDIAMAIDLEEAERRIGTATQRESIKHRRRAPRYFEYHPAPLRITQMGESHSLGQFVADRSVELVAYDFGAVSVIYRIPLAGDFSGLLPLSERLYENEELLRDSHTRVASLLTMIKPAVSSANVSSFVEDYLVFQIERFQESITVNRIAEEHAQQIAQVLRAEPRELSADEISDALSHRIAYGVEDITIVDWNAALIVDKEPEDALTVLEFANVELLEMRFLDRRLDDGLTQAYDQLSKRTHRWSGLKARSDLSRISQWQVDSAILFEGVNNVLKLLGDQYLARLYRLTAQRFHLGDWDASIFRKLNTLESIYEKLSDQIVTRRMEVLEWIIIILITVSILLPFITPSAH